MTDPITPEERRYLLSQIDDTDRTDSLVRKLMARHDEQSARLESVRVYVSTTTDMSADLVARRVLNILASQPEAPKALPPEDDYDTSGWRVPPKGPAAEAGGHGVSLLELAEGRLAAANARIAELESLSREAYRTWEHQKQHWHTERSELLGQVKFFLKDQQKRASELKEALDGWHECKEAYESQKQSVHAVCDDRDAAKARADAAERDTYEARKAYDECVMHKNDAIDRANAAERETMEADKSNEGLVEQIATVQIEATELRTERDQLAARVTELEADQVERGRYIDSLERMQCTPEERKVLKACRDAAISEDDHGDDDRPCFELDDAIAVTAAELANRAAKAKRGGA